MNSGNSRGTQEDTGHSRFLDFFDNKVKIKNQQNVVLFLNMSPLRGPTYAQAFPEESSLQRGGNVPFYRGPVLQRGYDLGSIFKSVAKSVAKSVMLSLNQSSDILQHSQNRPTGDRWLKF